MKSIFILLISLFVFSITVNSQTTSTDKKVKGLTEQKDLQNVLNQKQQLIEQIKEIEKQIPDLKLKLDQQMEKAEQIKKQYAELLINYEKLQIEAQQKDKEIEKLKSENYKTKSDILSMYPDSVYNSWWIQLALELKIEPKDYMEYMGLFINGEISVNNDSLLVIENGIAIFNGFKDRMRNKFEVYYFSEFMSDKVEFEINLKKSEVWEIKQGKYFVLTDCYQTEDRYTKLISDMKGPGLTHISGPNEFKFNLKVETDKYKIKK